MNTTDKIMALANTYAASYGKALLEKLYGTSQSYTEQCEAEAFKNREALLAEIEALVRDAERYRYMRNLAIEKTGMPGQPCIAMPNGMKSGYYLTEETADFAIDTAIRALKGKQ